ncbi:serine hydrolase domain-containing protein [Aliikangiella sp. IMCC44653]
MNKVPVKQKSLIISLILTLSACSQPPQPIEATASTAYQYQIPAFKNDGWQVAHLDDHGIDSHKINSLVKDIEQQTYPGIDSLSIVKDGYLLFHEDFKETPSEYDLWAKNYDLEAHLMHSVSKSFTGTLVGIAFSQGFLHDVATPLLEVIDSSNIVFDAHFSEKQSITLEDTLTMQLGLAWDEWAEPINSQSNSLNFITQHKQDYVKALLELPLIEPPGSRFEYNTAASIALAAVIENQTGFKFESFAQSYLFEPLQINHAQWIKTPSGLANAGSGLILKTRDMAKLGQLYLNKGEWNGYQVLSEKWVSNAITKQVNLNLKYTTGYGYQWWTGEFKNATQNINFYSSRGSGGQFIVVVPSYQLVVAISASNYANSLYEMPLALIESRIIPLLKNH